MFKKLSFILFLVAIACTFVTDVEGSSTYDKTLGSTKGFTGGTSITIASAAAVILPTLPSGCSEAWMWSDAHFNYGDGNVSTNTYELNWASGTHLHPLVLDKFTTPTPTVYFRTRGSATPSATIYIKFR